MSYETIKLISFSTHQLQLQLQVQVHVGPYYPYTPIHTAKTFQSFTVSEYVLFLQLNDIANQQLNPFS